MTSCWRARFAASKWVWNWPQFRTIRAVWRLRWLISLCRRRKPGPSRLPPSGKRMKRLALALLLFGAGVLCVFQAGAFQSASGYHLLKKIPLGAAEGGGAYFDYITFDAAARRVYL